MFRPQDPTSLQETEMCTKNQRELDGGSAGMDPIVRLRTLCLSRGANGILGLGRIFRRMDNDGRQPLSRQEFLEGLHDAGLEISPEEAETIFDKFDDGPNGGFNLTEFLVHMRPPLCESRQEVIGKAFRKMAAAPDHDFITIEKLRRTYNVKVDPLYISGEESEENIVKRLLANFEQNATRDGHVTHEEFFNYYSAIGASIDNDCYFDLMMRQAYKL